MDNLFNVNLNSMSDESFDIDASGEVVGEGTTETNAGEGETSAEATAGETAAEAQTSTDDLFDIDENGFTADERKQKDEKEDSEESNNIADANVTGDASSEATSTNSPDGEGESSPVIPFASLLHQEGVLPNLNLDEFSSSEDKTKALIEAVKKEIATANDNFVSSFPKELVDLAEAVKNGVPLESLKDHKVKELNYASINEASLDENISLQKRLVKESLMNKGFKEAKADRLVETYEDMDSLLDEAKDSLEGLKEYHKKAQEEAVANQKAQQKQMEENNAQLINNIKSTIDNTEEIIPGIKLNKSTREKTFNAMTQIVDNDENGAPVNYIMSLRAKDPLKFDMKLAYVAQLTNGFSDWSKITKTSKTNATKDFEKALTSNTSHKAGRHAQPKGGEVDPLEGLKGLFK